MEDIIKEVTENEYQHGFVTEVEQGFPRMSSV